QSETFLLRVVRMCLCRGQANRLERHRVEGRRRLPGDAGGWLWLGEIIFRTDVPAFPRRLRGHHANGAVSQRLRPAWKLRWRPRESASGDLSQSDRSETFGQA